MLNKIFSFCTTFNFTYKAPTSFTFSHRRFVILFHNYFLVAFLFFIFMMFLSCFCSFVCLSLLHSHRTFPCCWIFFVAFKFLMLSSSILQVLVALLSSAFKQLFNYVLHLSPNCISLSSTFTKVLFFSRFYLWSSISFPKSFLMFFAFYFWVCFPL
jgi:hypothetical protein